MKNCRKNAQKSSNGITLIALVITIIVLLILAGISISMLSGDNSILQKATDAKQTTERSEAKEQAQMDIMAYIADKTANHQDDSLDDTIVKGILTGKSYVKDGQPGNESFITAKGEYEILYSELYTATNSNVDIVDATKVAEINSKIGTVVNGYNVQSLEWQVFYADKSETILIAKTYTEEYYGSVPLQGENKDTEYTGSADVKNSIYGAKWNSKWLSKITQNNTRNNAKAIAYLCDTDNWSKYKTGSATYAAGGPTLELLIASWNESHNEKLQIDDTKLSEVGYLEGYAQGLGNYSSLTIEKESVYNPGDYYYRIASPCDAGDDWQDGVLAINYRGYLDATSYDESSRSMEPR